MCKLLWEALYYWRLLSCATKTSGVSRFKDKRIRRSSKKLPSSLCHNNVTLPLRDANLYLRFEFCNARSVCNKLHLLSHYLLSRNDLDLLFLTETWLNSMFTASMVSPRGYNLIRFDRPSRRGGGVLVLYKNSLQVHRVNVVIPTNANFETICIGNER